VKTPLQFGPIILTRLSANPLSFARAGKESTSVTDLWSAITFIAAGLNLRRSSPATIIGLPLVVGLNIESSSTCRLNEIELAFSLWLSR
jgi:hypothetical protein